MSSALLLLGLTVAAAQQYVTCPTHGVCTECTSIGAALVPISASAFTTTGFCVDQVRLAEPFDQTNGVNCSSPTCLTSRKGGPGWWINDKGILEQCTTGHYCPLNTTSGIYNIEMKCTDGEICPAAQTSPFECTWFNNCSGKKIYAGTGGLLLFFILLIAIGACERRSNPCDAAHEQCRSTHWISAR